MRRNKRCLLAYHRVRTQRLDEACWKGIESGILEGDGDGSGAEQRGGPTYNEAMRGGMVADRGLMDAAEDAAVSGGSTGNGSNNGGGGAAAAGSAATGLSPEEEEYVRQYSELLAIYKGKWTDVDLTGSLEPPRDLFIDVRVLKNAGEIQTEYGYVNSVLIEVCS